MITFKIDGFKQLYKDVYEDRDWDWILNMLTDNSAMFESQVKKEFFFSKLAKLPPFKYE